MSNVVPIVFCHWVEIQRKAARTEPEWTFADLYSSLSISDEYEVIDIKINCDGKMEWVSVELLQLTELCLIFQKNHVLFRVAGSETTQSQQNMFSVLMQGAWTIADKERAERHSESSALLPEHTVVNNKKDQLHNDVLCFSKDKNVFFQGKAETNTTGKQYIKTLVNVLWYVAASVWNATVCTQGTFSPLPSLKRFHVSNVKRGIPVDLRFLLQMTP